MKKSIIKPALFFLLIFAVSISILAQPGNNYYVDNRNPQASDSNPGTESLPWVHCPRMPGWSGSFELEAGDIVYFNNSCTWTVSSGNAVIEVTGGVTYDGKTWGEGDFDDGL